MSQKITPTATEVLMWLNSLARHVYHVEYYLYHLGIGSNDPERPHDIVGPGNKLEWGVMYGLALGFREPKPDFTTYILPSIELHRVQFHHRMWNDPDPNNPDQKKPEASDEDMQVGAIDAICSLLEPREYQGGMQTFESAAEIMAKNPAHKVPWAKIMLPRMEALAKPDLSGIIICDKNINFPNIGIPEKIHLEIRSIFQATMDRLFGQGCMFECHFKI